MVGVEFMKEFEKFSDEVYLLEYDYILKSLESKCSLLNDELSSIDTSVQDVLDKLRLKNVDIDKQDEGKYIPVELSDKDLEANVNSILNSLSGRCLIETRSVSLNESDFSDNMMVSSIRRKYNQQVIDLVNMVGELQVRIANKKKFYSYLMKVLLCNQDKPSFIIGEVTDEQYAGIMRMMQTMSSKYKNGVYTIHGSK